MTKREIDPFLEDQWETWLKENPGPYEHIDTEEMKEALVRDLTNVSNMTVEEYTLYQKWCEVKFKYPTEEKETLFGSSTCLVNSDQDTLISKIKSKIWFPKTDDDYLKLKPNLVLTDDSGEQEIESVLGYSTVDKKRTKELPETWNCIRTFTSTMKNNSNIGRNMNYIVQDDVTGKYLGVICISSDFLDLTPRDQFIGWDRFSKTQGHMINYTAIGSTIVPLQPLGYNYVGGKLLALLCLSDKVQQDWKNLYGDVLTGVTTTSLYGKNKVGGLSQYDGLKYWKKMGFSQGSIAYEVTKPTIKMLLLWLKENHTRRYFEWYEALKKTGQPYFRDHRNRSYIFSYQKLGIPKELYRSEHQRGIYFSPLYTNTREFLKGEIQENQLDKAFDTSYDSLIGVWQKYAAKRINSLKSQNRVSSETLFYDSLVYDDWETTKEKYLKQVGR